MPSSSVVRRHEFAPLPLAAKRREIGNGRAGSVAEGSRLSGAQIEEERCALIERARQQATGILAQTERDVEGLRLEARETGYRDGYEDGLAQAAAAQEDSVRAIAGLAERARVDAATQLRYAEEQVIELAVRIARKVIGQELTVNPGAVSPLVRAALEEMADATSVRVRVNPDAVAMLPGQLASGVELAADPELAPGDCVIDARSGMLDGRIETKLSEISAALREEWEWPSS